MKIQQMYPMLHALELNPASTKHSQSGPITIQVCLRFVHYGENHHDYEPIKLVYTPILLRSVLTYWYLKPTLP